MNLVYIHGLDSDANSIKGQLLENYCQKHHPDIKVHRPDLNQPPELVFSYLTDLVTRLNKDGKTALVGSSLGGYFSTLVSNHTGCPALLLNPSTQPHITLRRFYDENLKDKSIDTSHVDKETLDTSTLYTTTGGWSITPKDLEWFAEHKLSTVQYPNQIAAMIKEGDELLDANLSADFYRQHGAKLIMQAGGDHRFSDFAEHLPEVIAILQAFD